MTMGEDTHSAHSTMRSILAAAGSDVIPRWMQSGFLPAASRSGHHRNVLGFEDGISNPDERTFEASVLVGDEGPDWLSGGTYLVCRRLRVRFNLWEALEPTEQEAIIGRERHSGELLVSDDHPSHVEVMSMPTSNGREILRRSYTFDDGVDIDGRPRAGTLFMSYQRDPAQFLEFQNRMSDDPLSPYFFADATWLFALPPLDGAQRISLSLFDGVPGR